MVVKIDRLILKGFHYEDRHECARGLQEQLAILLSEPEMAKHVAQLGARPHLKVGQISVSPNTTPDQIGIATGDTIGKGLRR